LIARAISVVTSIAGGCAALQAPAWAQSGDLFSGKDIAIIVGTGPAGGYDVSARLFARYFGQHLPGNPNVMARNMPGAGGLRAANQIYNASPKDGTELGLFPTSVAMEPLFHNKSAKFETAKFNWIGNMDSDSADGCATWKHAGIKSWEDLKTRETTFGSSGPSGVSSINPRVIGALLGLKTKVIVGYPSTHQIIIAMQRGELDGSCALNLQATSQEFKKQIAAGELNFWITFGRKRSELFPDVPNIFELIKNDDDLQVAKLVFGQNRVNRAISAPPGLSQERVDALRAGFQATMKDEGFLSEAARLNVSVNPLTGEETLAIYQSFYDEPQSVVDRTIKIMGRVEED
jgi:tripartite-type tricarboxylate transporter receptor subunit TctC